MPITGSTRASSGAGRTTAAVRPREKTHGDIVEQGSHEELLAAKGAYHRLYTSQFRGGEDD
ncbi:hypothetical protein D9C01_13855, partial [Corynebacterium diphtheriae]